MDFRDRLAVLRHTMEERDIGLLYLPPGANLFYLSGIRRQQPHTTDANAYGDWAAGAFLGQEGGITLVTPRMGSAYFVEEAKGKPWIEDIRIILEGEEPQDVLATVARNVAARRGQIAVDDRMWALARRVAAPRGRIAVDDRTWARTLIGLRDIFPETEIVMASDLLAPMRMIKTPEELELMRHAAKLADEVYAGIVKQLRPGVTEFEIGHEIDHQFARLGAEYPSFVTGIRFNRPKRERLAEIRTTDRKLEYGDSITFDFGCVSQGYCSDFGRTAFLGEPPSEFVRMHDAVIASQQAAIQAMRAGEITAEATDEIARASLREAGYAEYFTHRLGHGIGVTVHEPPYLDVNDRTVLLANMTFTVEPSSRIPNGFACRVEDVVLVTPTGGVPLMNASRSLTVID